MRKYKSGFFIAILTVAVVAAGAFVADASNGKGKGNGKGNGNDDGSGSGGSGGDRVRIECDADATADYSMDARYESRRGRQKFDASFEAARGLGFEAGQVLTVTVGGVVVGEMVLFNGQAGDVEGDLNYDTAAQANDDDLPLPADFPSVTLGTSVVVGPLGCDLDD